MNTSPSAPLLKVSVKEEDSTSPAVSLLSISHTFDIPLVEGPSNTYDIVVPEKNDVIHESILENALKNKQRIAIRPVRLQLLLEVENKMKLLAEKKKKNLADLHSKEKSNPSAVNDRVKRYVETHRDEINARRREKRKTAGSAPSSTSTAPKSNIIIIKRIIKPLPATDIV